MKIPLIEREYKQLYECKQPAVVVALYKKCIKELSEKGRFGIYRVAVHMCIEDIETGKEGVLLE